MMKDNDMHNELKKNLRLDIEKLDKAKKERTTLLAQTVYLGALGFLFILPVILGAYLGLWLDEKLKGFSISWTISLIIVGVFVGVMNVYLFIRERE